MTVPSSRREPPPELAPFAAALARHLQVAAIDDLDVVLGLAGTAAHEVVRPAAPIAAYLLGAAAAHHPDRPIAEIASEVDDFIRSWAPRSR
jgi:hypothetical protein